jgi:hypothetical protein
MNLLFCAPTHHDPLGGQCLISIWHKTDDTESFEQIESLAQKIIQELGQFFSADPERIIGEVILNKQKEVSYQFTFNKEYQWEPIEKKVRDIFKIANPQWKSPEKSEYKDTTH